MASLPIRVAELTADNLILRGFIAYLFSKSIQVPNERSAALKAIFRAIEPEFRASLTDTQLANPAIEAAEIQRFKLRAENLLAMVDEVAHG